MLQCKKTGALHEVRELVGETAEAVHLDVAALDDAGTFLVSTLLLTQSGSVQTAHQTPCKIRDPCQVHRADLLHLARLRLLMDEFRTVPYPPNPMLIFANGPKKPRFSDL